MTGTNNPLVSVIVPFLNTRPCFFKEAIESVLAQTCGDWELLLVDDGSSEQTSDFARQYTAKHPGRIFYLEHDNHQNRGQYASRILGSSNARGEYIAFLDSDDVWLPNKLEAQVSLLENQTEAAMVYGNTQYWYSWTREPNDLGRNFSPKLGVRPDTLFRPPTLLPLWLRGRAAVPPPCSVLFRRRAVESISGITDSYSHNYYEDQVFFAKVSLHAPIFVSGQIWDKYRQHPESLSATEDLCQQRLSRLIYLRWLDDYISENHLRSPAVVEAVRKELWMLGSPRLLRLSPVAFKVWKLTRKWLLRLEEFFLSDGMRYRRWVGANEREN